MPRFYVIIPSLTIVKEAFKMFSEIYGIIMSVLIFFGIPIGILVWFIVSIVKYIKVRKEDEPYMSSRQFALVSLVLSSFFMVMLIALVIFFSMAIAHM